MCKYNNLTGDTQVFESFFLNEGKGRGGDRILNLNR